jgi:hypothetical protein
MSWLLLVMFVAVANLALGAGVAIATGHAPPLREIIDGIIYERYDDNEDDGDIGDGGDIEDDAVLEDDADTVATKEAGGGEASSAG